MPDANDYRLSGTFGGGESVGKQKRIGHLI